MRKANWTLLLVSLLSLGPASWAAGPGVPLKGVEVNSLQQQHFFGNGPTPFPIPTPPTPRPVPDGYVSAETALTQWSQAATWWTRAANGGLAFHDCEGRAEYVLAAADPNTKALVVGMQHHMSGDLTEALAPWKAAFRENIAMEELDGDLLEMEIINARWQRLVALHAEEIAVAVPLPSTAAGTCTTGRCDCKACPKKHTCDCQEYQTGWVDCFATQRLNCNVDESPDPRSGSGPVLDTRF